MNKNKVKQKKTQKKNKRGSIKFKQVFFQKLGHGIKEKASGLKNNNHFGK